MEVVGLALKHGATQVQKARLSARGAEAGKATVRIGKLLAKSGATIAAAAGLYDAVQAGVAANRTWKGGDTAATKRYIASVILTGIGTSFGIAAVSGGAVLLGPLGIAILFGLAGYAAFKLAEGEESTPFDRWARRCYFGNHNEKSPIHWDKPKHAHIAIAELNAATLGVEAGINFKLIQYSASAPQAGYSIASGGVPVSQQIIEYRVSLPYFDQNRSAYLWTLTAHRLGDGPLSNDKDDEVVVDGNLNPPNLNTGANNSLAAPRPQIQSKKTSNQTYTTVSNTSIRTLQTADNNSMHILDIKGKALLPDDRAQSNIAAATLSITYWPDRDNYDAYAKLILTDNI
ncbi:hypothetical protein D3C77_377810 [compost metagenome]